MRVPTRRRHAQSWSLCLVVPRWFGISVSQSQERDESTCQEQVGACPGRLFRVPCRAGAEPHPRQAQGGVPEAAEARKDTGRSRARAMVPEDDPKHIPRSTSASLRCASLVASLAASLVDSLCFASFSVSRLFVLRARSHLDSCSQVFQEAKQQPGYCLRPTLRSQPHAHP